MDEKVNGRLLKVKDSTKLFLGNAVDKMASIPDFAKKILTSADKSEENYHELIKMDKETMKMVLEHKIKSENYTKEELEEELLRWSKINEKLNEDSGKVVEGLNKHRQVVLTIVIAGMIAVLKAMLDNKKS